MILVGSVLKNIHFHAYESKWNYFDYKYYTLVKNKWMDRSVDVIEN